MALWASSGVCLGQETFSPEERAARVAQAEQEARAAFEVSHYTFVTPQGTVDPAEGGIPPFAVGLKRWTAYRGSTYLPEYRLLRAINRGDDARRVIRRKVISAAVMGISTATAAVSAGVDEDTLPTWARALGVFGGFTVGTAAGYFYQQNLTPLDTLFLPLQRINDQIRENLRAQYRLLRGVPLEPPGQP